VYLSRVVLRRGSQEAILQGMIHVAPDNLYEVLQGDVDWATANNYQIFFEGVKKHPAKKVATANEAKIKKFLLFLLDLYPLVATALGISLQKEKIKYPKDAINADIPLAELTSQLDQNGFKCNFLLEMFKVNGRKELKKGMAEHFAKQGTVNALKGPNKWSLTSLFVWFFFRKAKPIILDYRNKVAVTKVEKHANGRHVFVHYGEKHIKGLVRLFQKAGWNVKEITYRNLADYCEAS